jgi:hypothetical protein
VWSLNDRWWQWSLPGAALTCLRPQIGCDGFARGGFGDRWWLCSLPGAVSECLWCFVCLVHVPLLLRLGLVEPRFLCSACLLCGSGVGFLRSDLLLWWLGFFCEAFLLQSIFSLWVALSFGRCLCCLLLITLSRMGVFFRV